MSRHKRKPQRPADRPPAEDDGAGEMDGAAEDVFSYRATKDGRVLIAWRGRDVTVLKGGAAERFLARVAGAGEAEAQLAMAKATGNFKRGNERRS